MFRPEGAVGHIPSAASRQLVGAARALHREQGAGSQSLPLYARVLWVTEGRATHCPIVPALPATPFSPCPQPSGTATAAADGMADQTMMRPRPHPHPYPIRTLN